MSQFLVSRQRIEIALVGGSDREFDVYGDWIERSYGPDVVLVRYGDGRSTRPSTAAEIAAFLVDLSTADFQRVLRLAAGRPVIAIIDTQAEQAQVRKAGIDPARILAKPLSRARFAACLDPVLAAPKAWASDAANTGLSVSFDVMAGASPAHATVLAQARRIARSDAPIFLFGEAGTGKAACARAIHQASELSDRPFVSVDCSVADDGDLESQLFGRGDPETATGAFAVADGGTVFLDNVEALPTGLQGRLLRTLETGALSDSGGGAAPIDVRLVCATACDMQVEVDAGRFRSDLYYRLNVLPLAIPPLRDHPDDIVRLAEAMLASADIPAGSLASDAKAALRAYAWPGNVQELETVIRHVLARRVDGPITMPMLPAPLQGPAGLIGDIADDDAIRLHPDLASTIATALRDLEASSDGIAPLWVQEQRIIETALAACDGNVGKAAEALQISPSTIYRKMQAWQDRDTA